MSIVPALFQVLLTVTLITLKSFIMGIHSSWWKEEKKEKKTKEKHPPTHCFHNPVKIFLKVSGCHIPGCIAMKWWGLGCQYVYSDVRAVVSVLWCSIRYCDLSSGQESTEMSKFWVPEYWDVIVLGTGVLRYEFWIIWLWASGYWDERVMGDRVLRCKSSGCQGTEMWEFWISGYWDAWESGAWDVRVRVLRCESSGCQGAEEPGSWDVRVMDVRWLWCVSSACQSIETLEVWMLGYCNARVLGVKVLRCEF